MERIDLGDNSAKFIVSPSDTVESIQEVLVQFLRFRGWTLIQLAGEGTPKFTATFSAVNVNGSTKRIKLHYVNIDGKIYIGTSILTPLNEAIGFGEEHFSPTNHFARVNMHLVRANADIHFYCFASPRWCYFTSTNSAGAPAETITLADIWNGEFLYEVLRNWNTEYGYYSYFGQLHRCRPTHVGTYVNGVKISKHIKEFEHGEGEGPLLPSIYDHGDVLLAPPYSSYCVSLLQDVTVAVTSLRVTGCSELLDSDSTQPYALIDSSSIYRRMGLHEDIQNELVECLTLLPSNGKLVPILDAETAGSSPCYVISDPIDYSNINFSKQNFKFDGGNLAHHVHIASPKKGYNGELSGIIATQPDSRENFLKEVFLRVDDNYRLSESGQLRRFFVVNGHTSVQARVNARRGTYNPNDHNYQIILQRYYFTSYYPGDKGWAYRGVGVSNVLKEKWQDNMVNVNTNRNDAFLVPA